MSDDFLNDMRRNWREQDAEVEHIAGRLRRGLLISRLMLWLENGMGAFGLVFGAWAVSHGAAMKSGVVILAGVSLAVFAPLCAWLAWRARRAEPRWEDETPQGVLAGMVARTRTVEKLMRYVRLQGWMLIGLSAALWAVSPTGYVDADRRLVFITVFFVLSALGAFAWAVWRSRGARRERARCERLLAEFR